MEMTLKCSAHVHQTETKLVHAHVPSTVQLELWSFYVFILKGGFSQSTMQCDITTVAAVWYMHTNSCSHRQPLSSLKIKNLLYFVLFPGNAMGMHACGYLCTEVAMAIYDLIIIPAITLQHPTLWPPGGWRGWGIWGQQTYKHGADMLIILKQTEWIV